MSETTENNQEDINDDTLDLTRRVFLTGTAAVGSGLLAANLGGSSAQAATVEEIENLPRVQQEMVAPPFLPKFDHTTTSGPKIVEVEFVIEEKKMAVDDDGAEIWALTFNGSVPGPMIVVHEGDYIELTLKNPESNAMEHNIDFHASTGALGGGALTEVSPGEQVVLRFKADRTGVFVYHCAPGGAMIPYHVVHGMNGAIMVLPRDGIKDKNGKQVHYHRTYFIGEQDYYLAKDEEGEYKTYDSAGEDYADSMEVMNTLLPSHVVFNGAVGALTGDGALKAKVGETVLIIHAQANRDTRPHLIGGHGDNVWSGGSFEDTPQTNLETWFIAGGSAGAATYTFKQPGVYAYVNHNLIEAVLKGAAAHFVVEGEWDDTLMKQVAKPGPIS
ncbi:MAG: nitrite reductase, copper-containing [Rhodospirillales bacterium]|jgi:nitrite reductase (NO-forming)|nr:nitrite reductase, copper-containing [Rhodospirillales bacterium]